VSPSTVTLDGIGLRSGRRASVTLVARRGPVALGEAGRERPLAEAQAEDADRTTVLRAGGGLVATVEHLLAACAALGLHDGLSVQVRGGELPLLDGGALAFARALLELRVASSSPRMMVVRDETLSFRESRYTFRRAPGTRVAVRLSFDDGRLDPAASWDGGADDFVARIAPARTFAFAHEVAALVAAGHAAHVDPGSVVVIAPDGILASGAPFRADEPARHKLLDLLGDLFVYGGPPRGAVDAFRPGHRATHAIIRQALERGVVTC